MKAENLVSKGCLQRDSVEHEGYAGARSAEDREGKEQGGADNLLESILNRAYKWVKRNHGAPGVDGMTVEEALLPHIDFSERRKQNKNRPSCKF